MTSDPQEARPSTSIQNHEVDKYGPEEKKCTVLESHGIIVGKTIGVGKCGPEEKKFTVLESHGIIVGKTIGVGNYATVRIAKSEKHGCDVAVKIVSKFLAPRSNLNKHLPREIQVIRRLRHPNIIKFIQAIETSHRVFIIMEYAENGSLIDIIRKETFIDENRSRHWFRQLITVLDFCHERGIVHRDVKCENILMDRFYNLKLSDFGFARGQMQPQDGIVPLSETYLGSFAYASPEILRGIPYRPQLSDVWATGVVLYTMVFGDLPFQESNWSRLLKQVQCKITFPSKPLVSKTCRSLIARILVPQRSRPSTAEILADEWLVILSNSVETSTDNLPVEVPVNIEDRPMKITQSKPSSNENEN